MPKKHERWICNLCGKSFEEKEIAEECENNHIKIEDMTISKIGVEYLTAKLFPMIFIAKTKIDGKEYHAHYKLLAEQEGTPNDK